MSVIRVWKDQNYLFPGVFPATGNFLFLRFSVKLCNKSESDTILSHTETTLVVTHTHTHICFLIFYHTHWFTALAVVPQSASWCCSSAVGGGETLTLKIGCPPPRPLSSPPIAITNNCVKYTHSSAVCTVNFSIFDVDVPSLSYKISFFVLSHIFWL